jgi:hypothetical protein
VWAKLRRYRLSVGLMVGLSSNSHGFAFDLPAESFSKPQDIPLARTLVAQCTPLPCVVSESDPVRVGSLIRQGVSNGILDIKDVVCNPSEQTPLDVNKEDTVDRPADDQDLRRLLHGAKHLQKIKSLISSLGHDVHWSASSIVSETMVDVKQIRRALAAIPVECRRSAISNGYFTAISSRKFGKLSLLIRGANSSDGQLDELRLLLGEDFELTTKQGVIVLSSKEPRLFSVQSISVESFLRTHPNLK